MSPFGRMILTGTRNVLTVVEGAVWATNGFFPTIVTWKVEPPSLTVLVNLVTDVDPAVAARAWV